jgi:ketosteroid isomerase-like protein
MADAREVMNRVTEAIFNRDLETVKSLYASDAVIDTPDHGTIRGRDEIAAYFEEFIAAFPDASYEPVYEHQSGTTAIDEGFFVGTHTGPMTAPTGEAVPPTGKQVRARACDAATVENGVITSHRFYFDNLDFLEQLGLAPEA